MPLDATLAQRLERHIAARLARFDGNALSNSLWGLIKCRRRPSPATLRAILERGAALLQAADSTQDSRLSVSEAARLLWCAGMLECDLSPRAAAPHMWSGAEAAEAAEDEAGAGEVGEVGEEADPLSEAGEGPGLGSRVREGEEGEEAGAALRPSSLLAPTLTLFRYCFESLGRTRDAQAVASCLFAAAKLRLGPAAQLRAAELLVEPAEWREKVVSLLEAAPGPAGGVEAAAEVGRGYHSQDVVSRRSCSWTLMRAHQPGTNPNEPSSGEHTMGGGQAPGGTGSARGADSAFEQAVRRGDVRAERTCALACCVGAGHPTDACAACGARRGGCEREARRWRRRVRGRGGAGLGRGAQEGPPPSGGGSAGRVRFPLVAGRRAARVLDACGWGLGRGRRRRQGEQGVPAGAEGGEHACGRGVRGSGPTHRRVRRDEGWLSISEI